MPGIFTKSLMVLINFFQMDYTDTHSREDTSPENEDVKLFDVTVRDLSTPDSPDQSHQAVEQCTSSNIGQDLLQSSTVLSGFFLEPKIEALQFTGCWEQF